MKGLTSSEVTDIQKKVGKNILYHKTPISFMKIFAHEITEPMILLLFAVGIIYTIVGGLDEAVTIFIIITLLVITEVGSEYRAKKAIRALETLSEPEAKVYRDGKIVRTDTKDIVPGDLLVLNPGIKLAADASLKTSFDIQVDESIFSGESGPLDKSKGDSLLAGTTIVSGEGEAEVFAIGKKTEFGKIAEQLQSTEAPRTKLQIEMKQMTKRLVWIALAACIIIAGLGFLRGQTLEKTLLTGLSLAFATIPEELPIIITMILGLGAFTLSKHQLLVKLLKSAETLGETTVIVTDKTGTITENQLRINEFLPQDNRNKIAETARNVLSDYADTPIDQVLRSEIDGSDYELYRERNVTKERKFRSAIRKTENGYILFVSGAPEELFQRSANGVSKEVLADLEDQVSKGRRVIAVARRELRDEHINDSFYQLEIDLSIDGLISFDDPPRKGIRETLEHTRKAGIRTIMVTGDHPTTALQIAESVGIIQDRADNSGQIKTGKDIESMSNQELGTTIKKVSVFARSTPDQKLRIVEALRAQGEVVTVTGDGVNDSLALKAANVGVAMGKRGTDVAKEAAGIVLADDNYITISRGIFEGRKFFDNLRKGVQFYLSVKVGLITIFFLPAIFGMSFPFAPIQIILLELFMDLAASAGFVSEPRETDLFTRPPRDPEKRLFDMELLGDILFGGFILLLAVLGVYFFARSRGFSEDQIQTLSFSAWIFGHIFLAFTSRSRKQSIFSIGPLGNRIIDIWSLGAIGVLLLGIYIPVIGQNIGLTFLSVVQLSAVATYSFVVTMLVEIRKYFLRRPSGANR